MWTYPLNHNQIQVCSNTHVINRVLPQDISDLNCVSAGSIIHFHCAFWAKTTQSNKASTAVSLLVSWCGHSLMSSSCTHGFSAHLRYGLSLMFDACSYSYTWCLIPASCLLVWVFLYCPYQFDHNNCLLSSQCSASRGAC